MAIDIGHEIGNIKEQIEHDPRFWKAMRIIAAMTAITIGVGYYSLGVLPARYERIKASEMASEAVETPVGSPEYRAMFESAPDEAQDSAVEINMIKLVDGNPVSQGLCTATIVDMKSVIWNDSEGKQKYGTMYSGISANHCLDDAPDMYQITTPKDIFAGNLVGEPSVALPVDQIDNMTDGAMFSFVMEGGGLNVKPIGVDALLGQGEVDMNQEMTAITFPNSVVQNYPRVLNFKPSDWPSMVDNQVIVDEDAFKGESGSSGFTQDGKSTGLLVATKVALPELFHYSEYPPDIRAQMQSYIDNLVQKNDFKVVKVPGYFGK